MADWLAFSERSPIRLLSWILYSCAERIRNLVGKLWLLTLSLACGVRMELFCVRRKELESEMPHRLWCEVPSQDGVGLFHCATCNTQSLLSQRRRGASVLEIFARLGVRQDGGGVF